MLDSRLKKVADTVLDYSLSIKLGDRVLIETTKNCSDILKYMIQKISEKGAIPFVMLNETDIKRELIKNGTIEQFQLMRKHTESILENVDVYINMIDSDNCYDMSDVPSNKKSLYQQYYFKPIYFEIIVPKLRWITVDYPSVSSAQQFGMSTEAYENYFFQAMTTDYKILEEKMLVLKELLDRGQHIQILSPTIDFEFNIKQCKSAICSGKINLPDGEILIAPDLYSANGHILFNVPTRYQGNDFQDLFLRFENGRVIEYNARYNIEKLKQILESDEGNKYIGEFAFGTNPNIEVPRSNILFDEKILGSFHIALGNSHNLSDNGNRASIHWDIVNMMTLEYNGGKIIIDDELIQENGIFVPKSLQPLNKVKKLERN